MATTFVVCVMHQTAKTLLNHRKPRQGPVRNQPEFSEDSKNRPMTNYSVLCMAPVLRSTVLPTLSRHPTTATKFVVHYRGLQSPIGPAHHAPAHHAGTVPVPCRSSGGRSKGPRGHGPQGPGTVPSRSCSSRSMARYRPVPARAGFRKRTTGNDNLCFHTVPVPVPYWFAYGPPRQSFSFQ